MVKIMSIENLPKRIGITGATGFLGANFLVKLLDSESIDRVEKIVAFYSKTRWNPLLLNIENEKIVFENLDITDYNQALEKTKDLDCIVHFAAMVSFAKKDVEKLWKINVEGTYNILNAAIENKVKKFILISSISILNRKSEKDIITEDDIGINPQNPRNNIHSYKSNDQILEFYKLWMQKDKSFLKNLKLPYHDTKLASFILAKEFVKGKDIELVTVLPGIVLGKGDNHYSITKLVDRIYKNKLLFSLPGNVSLVHVEDLSEGIIAAIIKGKKDNEYILSGNQNQNLAYSNLMKSIAINLKKISKKFIISNFIVPPYFMVNKLIDFIEKIFPNFPVTYEMVESGYSKKIFSIEKAEKELEYKIKRSFEQTIKDLCDDFIQRDISKYLSNKKHFLIIRNIVCSNWAKENSKIIINYDKEIENCPRKVYIVNHPTTYDFFTLVHIAKNNFYLPVEKTAFDVPIVGYFLKKAGFLPVYKNKKKNSEIIDKMVNKARLGHAVLNSIRSEIIASGIEGRLRTGGVVIADISKADIIPLHIYIEKDKLVKSFILTQKFKKAPIIKFNKALVFVSFLKPLKYKDYHKDNMTKEDYCSIIEKINSMFIDQDQKIDQLISQDKEFYKKLPRKGGSDLFIEF